MELFILLSIIVIASILTGVTVGSWWLALAVFGPIITYVVTVIYRYKKAGLL